MYGVTVHDRAIKYNVHTVRHVQLYTICLVFRTKVQEFVLTQWQQAIVCFLCLISNFFPGFLRRHSWLVWHVIIATKSFWLAKSARNASKFNEITVCICMYTCTHCTKCFPCTF